MKTKWVHLFEGHDLLVIGQDVPMSVNGFFTLEGERYIVNRSDIVFEGGVLWRIHHVTPFPVK